MSAKKGRKQRYCERIETSDSKPKLEKKEADETRERGKEEHVKKMSVQR